MKEVLIRDREYGDDSWSSGIATYSGLAWAKIWDEDKLNSWQKDDSESEVIPLETPNIQRKLRELKNHYEERIRSSAQALNQINEKIR